LREAAADARFFLDDRAGVGDGSRRVRAEVLFEGRGVLVEDAGPPAIVPGLDGVESPAPEVGEATLNRGLGQAGELSNLGLGQSMSGEPEDFHPLLDLRTRVVKAVVVDLFEFGRRELEGWHGFLPRGDREAGCYPNRFMPETSVLAARGIICG